MTTNNWTTPARIRYWESLKGRKQEKSPNWKGDLNGNMFKNWQEEFNKISSLWAVDQIEWENAQKFVSSLLESQRQQLIQEIKEKYGKDYGNGCGCCGTNSLGEALEKDYPSLQVNKDL